MGGSNPRETRCCEPRRVQTTIAGQWPRTVNRAPAREEDVNQFPSRVAYLISKGETPFHTTHLQGGLAHHDRRHPQDTRLVRKDTSEHRRHW
jgi:hypothetical protein